MKNGKIASSILLLAAVACMCYGCVSHQHPFAKFRSASTVRIVKELDIQGFDDSVSVRTIQGTFAIRADPKAPHLPVEEIGRELLKCAGLQLIKDDTENCDIILRISAQGRGLMRSYSPRASKTEASADDQPGSAPGPYAGDRVFTVPTGFFLQGTISLEIPQIAVYQKNFTGTVRPPGNVDIEITSSPFSRNPLYLEYTKPSGSHVCNLPGSFTQRAVETIGEIFGVPFLLTVIRSQPAPIDEYAENALSFMTVGRADEDLLIAALEKDREWRIRRLAAEALGKIGSKRAAEPLVTAMRDEEWRVRQKAAEALGKMGGKRVMKPLIAAMRDEEWRVRQKAAEALGKMGGKRVVEPLVTAMRDEEWRIRLLAAEALGEIGDKRAVEPLIGALRDREFGVRYHAVVALEKLNDSRAVGPLIMALDDEDVYFRNRVLMALKKITGKDISTDPEVWQNWWKENEEEY